MNPPKIPACPRQLSRKSQRRAAARRLLFEPLETRELLAVMPGVNPSAGTEVITYKLALATTQEATIALGGETKAKAFVRELATELSKNFERELSIRFELVANNDMLISATTGDDGYTNAPLSTLIGENTGVINTRLNGNATNNSGYDIGHVLSTAGGGLGSPSVGKKDKGAGASSVSSGTTVGQILWLTTHEVGHQFGADHSFNGKLGTCTERSPTNAYEPGSGASYLSYLGNCGTDNLSTLPGEMQPFSMTNFHAASIDQIIKFITTDPDAKAAGTRVATSNNLPTVSAGAPYTIPANTPFTLTATGNDADTNDKLTYSWEQIDSGGSIQEVLIGATALTVGGNPANAANTLNQLDQTTAQYVNGDQVKISGTDSNGNTVNGTYTFDSSHTIANLLKSLPDANGNFTVGDSIGTTFPLGSTASLDSTGKLRLEAANGKDAQLALTLTNADTTPATGNTTFGSFSVLIEGRNDPGGVNVPISAANDSVGPLFRSYFPKDEPSRTFPRLESILANTPQSSNKDEHLPTQARDLNFRVTVRDNHAFAGGGGIANGIVSADTKLTVAASTGFKVDYLNTTGQTITGGTSQTINWMQGGTHQAPISTSKVDVLLSIDGGQTFPITLLSGTDNDGTETITFPNIDVQQARLKIQADPAQNIFFDINDENFEVNRDPGKPAVVITETNGTIVGEGVLKPATDTYTVGLTTAPTAPVTITITADPQTKVSVDGTNFATTQTLTFATGVTAAKTVTVQAADDTVVEGVHSSVIRNTVTASTDTNYDPAKFVPEFLTATVADDEDAPLVAIDFDFSGSPSAPTNWTLDSTALFGTRSYADMIREDGYRSTVNSEKVGLEVKVTGATSITGPSASIDSNTVPQHIPDVTAVTGAFGWPGATAVDATWSGLAPSTKYRVYSFLQGAHDAGTPNADQKISIKGIGTDDPTPFDQKPTAIGPLFVNDMAGSSSANIKTYGKTVTSKADGTLKVEIRPNTGATALYVSGLAVQQLAASPGFEIKQTGGNTIVSETQTTDTFTVKLNSQPGSNVVIDVRSGNTGEATVDKSSLTFTPTNWNAEQTVTVTGVDDSTVDGNQTHTMTLSIDDAQSDDVYDPLPDQTISVTTTDDDTAGFTVTETGGGTTVAETGTTDTFSVQLSAQPTSNVVLSVTSGDTGEATVNVSTLTFTMANWNTAQTVTVTGVDDPAIDGSQTTTVTVSVVDAQSHDSFDPLPDQTVSVTTTDDDVAGFTVAETGGSTAVAEPQTTDTFTVVLNAQPTSNVVVNVTSGDTGEVTIPIPSLTFTTSNWNVAQTVTVRAADDVMVDATQATTVTVSIDDPQSDDAFDPLADQTVTVTTTDDDQAGFSLGQTTGKTVSEAMTTDSFTAVLTAQPLSNVVLDVTSGDTGEAVVDKPNLTFTPANWNTAQTVTITGVDDTTADGSQSTTITLSVNDPQSDNFFDALPDQTLSVTTTDDDQPGFTVTQTGGQTSVAETATMDTFMVRLTTPPASNVVLSVTSGDTGEATVDMASLTFTPANWSTDQTVTVTGVDDAVDDGSQTTLITISVIDAQSDDAFDPLADQTVSVTTTDDDQAGFTVVETSGATVVTEAGLTDTFTVVLDTLPTSNVVIGLTSADTGEATVSPSSLTFTPANWNTTQTVTVTGVDDAALDGTQTTPITLAVIDAQSDNAFDPLADQTVSVATTDDDQAGFTVVETGGTTIVTEAGQTDTFTVVLDSPPASNVVIDVASGDTGEATVSAPNLTFTPANWSTAQTVTVTGVADGLADGDQTVTVTLSVDDAQSDNAFDPLADQTVSVTNRDSSQPGFTIAESSGSTQVSETGTTDTFTVLLDLQPASNVVLSITSGDTGEATVDQASLTFTPANWNITQTVTVTGQDDTAFDGSQTTPITVSVVDAQSDNAFDPLADQTVSVTTTDNEQAGFTITPTGTTVVSEAATTDSFNAKLDAQPISNVVLNVVSGDTGETTVSPSSLTFTPANWNVDQTVTVTGVDDPVVDGSQTTTVTISVDDAQSDDNFDPLADQTVSVSTTDDDQAGFSIVESGGGTQVSETASMDTFTAQLSAQPLSAVVLSVISGDTSEVTVDNASLTFTPANWNQPQTVTVTGVDDVLTDGNQTSTITLSVVDAQSDNAFDPLADQTVSVTTTDNDQPGFTITETGGATRVTEAGGTDTFDVVLHTQPSVNVVLDVTSADTGEATVSPASLTFTPANWNVAQSITVTGVDDLIDDGDQTTAITVSVNDPQSDDQYDPLADQTVSATTTDDDQVELVVTQSSGTTQVSESAATDTFTVHLGAQPNSNVVLNVTTGNAAEAMVNKMTLTFTPANSHQPQTVTVTGVDDALVDGDQTVTITVSVDDPQSDNLYDPVADQLVTAINLDNEAKANIPRGNHIIDSRVGVFTAGNRIQDYRFQVPAGTAPAEYVFLAANTPGSQAALALPQLFLPNGTPIRPSAVVMSNGRTLVRVPLGPGTYIVRAAATNTTGGAYELAWMMPGIMATAQPVSDRAVQLATAGNLFSGLGNNFVAAQWLEKIGITPSTNTYQPGLDANGNGKIDPFDLDSVTRNHGLMRPAATLTPTNTTIMGNPEGEGPVDVRETFGFSLRQNPGIATDVTADGEVTPIDALQIVNALNEQGAHSVQVQTIEDGILYSDAFLDVNGDYHVSPLDALVVINDLNSATEDVVLAEGEGSSLLDRSGAVPIVPADTNASKTADVAALPVSAVPSVELLEIILDDRGRYAKRLDSAQPAEQELESDAAVIEDLFGESDEWWRAD